MRKFLLPALLVSVVASSAAFAQEGVSLPQPPRFTQEGVSLPQPPRLNQEGVSLPQPPR